MQTVIDVLSQKAICFSCNGDLQTDENILVCSQCSRKYIIQNRLINFDDPELKSRYGKIFKEEAENYESLHLLDDRFSIGVASTQISVLKRHIRLPVSCALEIGCGTGVLTRGYYHFGVADMIVATDISREMLTQAALRETSDKVLFAVQDVHDLKFKDNSFEVVFGGSILHHLTHLDRSLNEISRVMRNDGVAIFGEPLYQGNRFLVFLIKTAFEFLKLQQAHPHQELDRLGDALTSYANNIEFRHKNRNSPEILDTIDDKYLFVQEDLENLATRVGFKKVLFFSPWAETDSWKLHEPEKIWKAIAIEIIEALQKEIGLENLVVDYSKIPSLDLVDDLVGHELIKLIPPHGIVVFKK